jgi:hypothetical protein
MIFTDWIHRFALDTLTSQDLARLHAAFEAGQDHEREVCAKLLEDATGTNSMRPRVPYIVNDFSFADVAAIVEAKLKEKNK